VQFNAILSTLYIFNTLRQFDNTYGVTIRESYRFLWAYVYVCVCLCVSTYTFMHRNIVNNAVLVVVVVVGVVVRGGGVVEVVVVSVVVIVHAFIRSYL
jgi:hypothetical protein